MPFRRRLHTSALLALLAASSISPELACAQDSAPTASASASSGPSPSPADVAEARHHFERAREDYGKGAYREAIGELEAAHGLDPTAKDLVFNLGVVHEKLGDIDEALDWFHLYTTMTLTPTERDRADSYIRRLEGAKKELANKPPPATGATATARSSAAATPPPRKASPSGPGRIDAATITAVSVAGAALIFGVVMAAKAADDKPINGFVTGQDGSYTDLNERTDSAHREAVIADVGFGVSLAAGITATILYFARARDGKPAAVSGRARPASALRFGAAPLAHGGGAVVLGGRF
jgi:hypothetical protein